MFNLNLYHRRLLTSYRNLNESDFIYSLQVGWMLRLPAILKIFRLHIKEIQLFSSCWPVGPVFLLLITA